MADEVTLEQLPELGSVRLDPAKDYYWTGVHVRKGLHKPDERVLTGTYEDWFMWCMGRQRFRSFQTVVLVGPIQAVSVEERGGYIDGFLARLIGKARNIAIISKPDDVTASTDELRARAVIRALLYGTRLTRPEILQQLSRTFVPIDEKTLAEVFPVYAWRISKDHPRYQLDEDDEELLEGMMTKHPANYDSEPVQIERLFRLKRRFRPELGLPDDMLSGQVMVNVQRWTWVTAPFEAKLLNEWLLELNRQTDARLERIYRSREFVSDEQWLRLLSPSRKQIRRVLGSLVSLGKLERATWYRELGRPAFAYSLPGKQPFLKNQCGRCAFYISSKRRCSLWHLANQTAVFFHPRWRGANSKVTEFEIHKMRYASKVGPHSSGCLRFVDKKRDHLRKSIPARCEICGMDVQQAKPSATCQTCGTVYVKRWDGKIRVKTAYKHDFDRIYRDATGGDSKADLEAYKAKVKEYIETRHEGVSINHEDEDALAEETEIEPEPPRVSRQYNKPLQEKVDALLATTDIAKQFTVAMARSALVATRRIIEFGKAYRGDAEPLLARQERLLALIEEADRSRLLPYEAQIMREYWESYRLTLRGVPEIWFGPRKRARFVTEFVEGTSAMGYSPVDAAINYLHQRRLRQAERLNKEAGFPGTSDGFLHHRQHNSRKLGILFDMIDPFKFADREELLLVLLNYGITKDDFRVERDRRGMSFYHPVPGAVPKLDQAGAAADGLVVNYLGREMRLSEAYRLFAEGLLRDIESGKNAVDQFSLFVFNPPPWAGFGLGLVGR